MRITIVAPAFGMACTKYGVALPTVSAPTTVPIASPRLAQGNHVEAIFIAGGYTPANENPVMKRIASAIANPLLAVRPAFAAAPMIAAAGKIPASRQHIGEIQ